MENIDLTEARVYVCTDHKYNQDRYSGDWLELVHYKNMDEFTDACHKIHLDERQPIFNYFSYENLPDVYVTQHWLCPDLFRLIRFVTNNINTIDQDIFSIWFNRYRPDLSSITPDCLMNAFQYCYEGEFRTEILFGKNYAKEQLAITPLNSPDFDFYGYTDLLFNDLFDYVNGHVFKQYRRE